MSLKTLVAVPGLALVLACASPLGAAEFVETFDGAPAHPTAWSSPIWDIAVHDRTDGAKNVMHAHHDDMCGPPPASHVISSTTDAVYLCRDHLMTALTSSDPGYAALYLTPAAMVDWSAGPATVEFDVSTGRTTKRDWIDVWLTPWEQNAVLPAEPGTPDLNGPPREALHFRLTNEFAWSVWQFPQGKKLSQNDWKNLPVPFSHNQRDRFIITLGPQAITVHYLNVVTRVMTEVERIPYPADLQFRRAVVQFGHHSYTPDKDCSFMSIGACGPNTWHWDNVRLSSAKAFATNKLDAKKLTSPTPAKPGWLRFAARGATEINWGSGWQAVEPVNGPAQNEGQFASFFLPIPADAKQIQLRGKPTWAGPWRAEHAAIWTLPSPAGQ
jgi:hypothetical protein